MLELSSNTIKVLGVFGRLSEEQEEYFNNLENKYSKKPNGNTYDIFRHLTLTFIPDASIADLNEQLDLLSDLKRFLPLKVRAKRAFVKSEESLQGAEHIAIEFDLSETNEVVDFIRARCGDLTVATWYTKVVWFVPKENQPKVIEELKDFKAMNFTDFYLVANKQNEENTIYRTSDFVAKKSIQ